MSLVTRWAGLAGLAGLLGGLVLAGIVLPPGDEVMERRLIVWTRSCVILLLATSGAELLLRARTMAGGDLASGLAAVPTALTRTHFGVVWMARGVALLALLVLVGRRARAAWAAAFGAGLAVAFTTALVGHAADRGDLSLMTLIDWLHVVAAAVWTGGLFCLAVVVLREARGWPRARVAVAMRRFSTLAGVCLVAVVASGVFNAWMQLGALDALWTSTYGRILFAKVLLVLAVAALGAVNRFRVLPGLGGDASRTAVDRLGRYVACEAGLALLVFGCTALLTDSTPPHHHEREMAVWVVPSGRSGSVAAPLRSPTASAKDLDRRRTATWSAACFDRRHGTGDAVHGGGLAGGRLDARALRAAGGHRRHRRCGGASARAIAGSRRRAMCRRHRASGQPSAVPRAARRPGRSLVGWPVLDGGHRRHRACAGGERVAAPSRRVR